MIKLPIYIELDFHLKKEFSEGYDEIIDILKYYKLNISYPQKHIIGDLSFYCISKCGLVKNNEKLIKLRNETSSLLKGSESIFRGYPDIFCYNSSNIKFFVEIKRGREMKNGDLVISLTSCQQKIFPIISKHFDIFIAIIYVNNENKLMFIPYENIKKIRNNTFRIERESPIFRMPSYSEALRVYREFRYASK